jgi:hypothetical protein
VVKLTLGGPFTGAGAWSGLQPRKEARSVQPLKMGLFQPLTPGAAPLEACKLVASETTMLASASKTLMKSCVYGSVSRRIWFDLMILAEHDRYDLDRTRLPPLLQKGSGLPSGALLASGGGGSVLHRRE